MGTHRNGNFVFVTRELEDPPAKRARPNFYRCHQCRQSRIKCLPENREWPKDKCDNCVRRNLPCSENVRKTTSGGNNAHNNVGQSTKDAIGIHIDYQTGMSLVDNAARNGYMPNLKTLLRQNPCWFGNTQSKRWTPLHSAAENGHLEVARFFLQNDISPHVRGELSETPLWVAAKHGHHELVELLLAWGAYPDAATDVSGYRRLPIHVAASGGFVEVVRTLLQNGVNPEPRTSTGRSPLHEAASEGHMRVVKFLVNEEGLDINSTTNDGLTSLWLAADAERWDIVPELISMGASLSDKEISLLIDAASLGCFHLVKYLLLGDLVKFGAVGLKALFRFADERKECEILRTLVHTGTGVDAIDELTGRKLLHFSAEGGENHVLELLIRLGADIEAQDNIGDTPLSLACANGHQETVKSLIEAGAKSTWQLGTIYGVLIAAKRGHHDIVVEMLPRIEANIEVSFPAGRQRSHSKLSQEEWDAMWDATLMLFAAQHGWEDIVVKLDQMGATYTKRRNFAPYTPLYAAAEKGNMSMVSLLVGLGAPGDTKASLVAAMTSPLIPIARLGHYEMAHFLLRFENHSNFDKYHIVNDALLQNLTDVAKLVIGCPSKAETKRTYMGSLLNIAIVQKSVVVATTLLQMGAATDIPDFLGHLALHQASVLGEGRMVKLLLRHGANVQARNQHGITALHGVIMSPFSKNQEEKLNICEMLLEAGADVYAKANNGHTPLMVAACHSTEEVLRLLKRFGADGRTISNKGLTAAQMIPPHLHTSSVKALLNSSMGP